MSLPSCYSHIEVWASGIWILNSQPCAASCYQCYNFLQLYLMSDTCIRTDPKTKVPSSWDSVKSLFSFEIILKSHPRYHNWVFLRTQSQFLFELSISPIHTSSLCWGEIIRSSILNQAQQLECKWAALSPDKPWCQLEPPKSQMSTIRIYGAMFGSFIPRAPFNLNESF